MKRLKLFTALLAVIMVINTVFIAAVAKDSAFELIRTDESEGLGGTLYYYKHKKTGAEVVYNDNKSDRLEFALGFKTPPTDSKGANHVLEHALFCGSEKYPIKNIMHYIQNGTSSLILNGVTADDCTYYLINSRNKTEYYNMIDVYMNGIFHPMFLEEKNIFRQQGIRIEYENGKARYNGVVYNELRIKNLNTEENSVNFLVDKLYRAIYGDTTPSFSAGGELDAIKELTYDDLLMVYNKFYIPSNSMTYLAGNQDIDKSLDILDMFFSENDAKAPDILFEDTKQIPSEPIMEYNVEENTKTVDIGFMSSGVTAEAGANELYARDILFNIIHKKMEEETGYTKTYISGGNTGGVSNLAFMISEIPVGEKEKVISSYGRVLDALLKNGIDEKDINEYIEEKQRYFYANWESVFNGILYHSDPIAYTEINSVCDYLKNNKEYFTEILKKYFTENPYSITIVSGNGSFSAEDSSVNVTQEELERIRLETEEFQRWNDEEDNPEDIEKIPFLTLDEVKNAPEKSEPKYEEHEDISFYCTDKTDGETSLYFPLDIKDEDLDYVQLMNYFIQKQAEKSGIDFYTMLMPFGNAENSEKINPHFMIGFSSEGAAEKIKEIISFLKSDSTWNKEELEEYIRTTPQKILDSYFDPYYLSSELKGSALSAEGRFSYLIPLNTIVKGSPHYYYFLKELSMEDTAEIAERIRTLAQKIIIESKPVVGYLGKSDDFNGFKSTVTELFENCEKHTSAELRLPIGCYSAATITKLADANHFMIAGAYDKNKYSGKLAVLGKVLTSRYIIPTMRGKHGAYGAKIAFSEDGMVSVVAGMADIDLAIEIWQGIGNYLRNLKMTQNELNAFIVSAVQEYDEWDYYESEHGEKFALKGEESDSCEKIRKEMLSVTAEDLRGYADFVDSLVSQKRVFAVLGKDAADNAEFDFAYYANADTLEVMPRLKKKADAYIQGRTDEMFAPDDCITRAEASVLIARIIADQRDIQGSSPFTDIKESDWFYNAVVALSEKGIISGYEDGQFNPDEKLTRAELSEILSKFIFSNNYEMVKEFSDVSNSDWFYEAMCKMLNEGYIAGYGDNTVRPSQPVTRAEIVTIINRMLNLQALSKEENPFTDVEKSHWAYNEILAAAVG